MLSFSMCAAGLPPCSGLTLINGELQLTPEQGLVVAATGACFTNLRICSAPISASGTDTDTAAHAPTPASTAVPTNTRGGSSSSGGGVSSGTAGLTVLAAAIAKSRPAVLVIKQSYTEGGSLQLTGCKLELDKHLCSLHVKGKGCSVSAESCQFSGSMQHSMLVQDGSFSGSSCELQGCEVGVAVKGAGQVTLSDCRMQEQTLSALVVEGGKAELMGCELSGAAAAKLPSSCPDFGPGSAGEAPAAAQASTSTSGRTSSDDATGPGTGLLVVQGKGSSARAVHCKLLGHTSAGVSVSHAGALALEDCLLSGSAVGVRVGLRGGRVSAVRCEVTGAGGCGVEAGMGASLDLKECQVGGCRAYKGYWS